jgi:hypothetical protein
MVRVILESLSERKPFPIYKKQNNNFFLLLTTYSYKVSRSFTNLRPLGWQPQQNGMAAAAAASSTHQISIPDSQYQMPLPD